MGKIDVFKLSHGVGDRVVIYRNSGGGDIRGVVEDIGDGYILLRRTNAKRPDAVFEEMISGFGDDDAAPSDAIEAVEETTAEHKIESVSPDEVAPEVPTEQSSDSLETQEEITDNQTSNSNSGETDNQDVYRPERPKMGLSVVGYVDLSKFEPHPKQRIKTATDNTTLPEHKAQVSAPVIADTQAGVIRANKVIKEFNIGLATLKDFLDEHGIEFNPSPNTKISEDAYELVKKEFGASVQGNDGLDIDLTPSAVPNDQISLVQSEAKDSSAIGLDIFKDYISKQLEELNSRYSIEDDELLSAIDNLSSALYDNKGTIEENAYITAVKPTYCLVEKLDGTELKCYLSRIPDPKLLYSLKMNGTGEKVPVLIFSYELKNSNKENIAALTGTYPTVEYLNMLDEFVYEKNYVFAKLVLDIILNNKLIKAPQKSTVKKYLTFARNELKRIAFTQYDLPILRLDGTTLSEDSDKMAYKRIEMKIKRALDGVDGTASAAQIIDEAIENEGLSNKYISSLLLTKAQMYSSADDVPKACDAYRELILFNESSGASKNNLSHLYCELARLLSLDGTHVEEAIKALDAAIDYNPSNKLAADLRKLISAQTTATLDSNSDSEDSLIITSTARGGYISKMIDVDIQEFRFTNKDVLENNGVPTPAIAQSLYDEAVKSTDPETYPKYLEAAKAYRGLKVGSYNLQNYLYVIASYSRLKGNHLLGSVRKAIVSSGTKPQDSTIILVRRLKDSAQSYYLETLDLWSSISPDVFDYLEKDKRRGGAFDSSDESTRVVLEVLANYLELDVAFYYFQTGKEANFNAIFDANFKEIFSQCICSKNAELEKIAYKTVLQIGSNSIATWNKLAQLPNGTGVLYQILKSKDKRQHVYSLLNNLLNSNIDESLSPGLFFKECFQKQSDYRERFEKNSKILQEGTLEPHSIESISRVWLSMSDLWWLLSETETETKQKVDLILSILHPYLSRKDVERTNLLIQAQDKIEEQIKFINDNTTYYGRTFFFSLLSKWRSDLKGMLDERIKRTYPILSVQADPQYILKTANQKIINLLVTNDGESSADKYLLEIAMTAGGYSDIRRMEENEVLAAGEKKSVSVIVTDSRVADFPTVDIQVKVTPYYLSNPVEPQTHSFTVENEPDGEQLQLEDILWSDSKTPTAQLFVGREEILERLARHYRSIEKHEPYILYGLTRTGKSSILNYLADNINGTVFKSEGSTYTIIPFFIDFSTGAGYGKASDFWDYVINECVYDKKLEGLGIDENFWHFNKSNPRAKDFGILLNDLKSIGLYPLFLIDEFSYIKTLIEKDIVNTAFLHSLRQYSLNGLASFIYAGTYDIKSLLKDSKYGFTGALVTAHDEQIDRIDDKSAERLMDVMKDKGIVFTDEAKSNIHILSGNIPYFVQILCKNCAFFAVENKRKYIGYPELEQVVNILVGKEASLPVSMVLELPENKFQNNQFSPLDPPEVSVLISSIVHFNRGQKTARGVSLEELVRLWGEHGIQAYNQKLSNAIGILLEKKVLKEYTDEGRQVYKLSVDLFRRWWETHHQDIKRELSTIM